MPKKIRNETFQVQVPEYDMRVGQKIVNALRFRALEDRRKWDTGEHLTDVVDQMLFYIEDEELAKLVMEPLKNE